MLSQLPPEKPKPSRILSWLAHRPQRTLEHLLQQQHVVHEAQAWKVNSNSAGLVSGHSDGSQHRKGDNAFSLVHCQVWPEFRQGLCHFLSHTVSIAKKHYLGRLCYAIVQLAPGMRINMCRVFCVCKMVYKRWLAHLLIITFGNS